MTDRYCVLGNPVAHSRSPAIHARFAAQCRQDLVYEAQLAPLDGFTETVRQFVAAGGKGANVTVPFKEEAFRLCTRRSARAERAGVVNTLAFAGGEIHGDNTDGAGLVRDIEANLGFALAGKRVLLLGAGGAARGVIAPLLACHPLSLFIANRGDGETPTAEAQAHAARGLAAWIGERLAGREGDAVAALAGASEAGDAGLLTFRERQKAHPGGVFSLWS